jgi:hypothetical protein
VTVLDKPFSLTDIAGLALILAGVSLGTGVAAGRRRRAAVEAGA